MVRYEFYWIALFPWLPNNISWLSLLSFLPLTINIRAGDWLLLLPFMHTPQACKSATDSWNHLPVSCPPSHSLLMGLRGHKEYTNIVSHIDSNIETQRLDFGLIASAHFSLLGSWYKAVSAHWTFSLSRGWQKGSPDKWHKWIRRIEMLAAKTSCKQEFYSLLQAL